MRRLLLSLCVATLGTSLAAGCGTTVGRSGHSGGGVGSGGNNNNGNTGNNNGSNNGGGDDGGGITPDGGISNNCGVQNFMLVHGNTPDLLIVQDRSGSMSDDANDNPLSGAKDPTSKWIQMVNAIEQVVQTVNTIDWGLEMFSSDGQCGAPMQPDVPVGANSGAAIKTALDASTPNGLTPTAAAINAAVAYFGGMIDNDGHPKYLLLATDGEPNCGAGGFGADDAGAEMAVSAAATAGIHTFVVGIGGNTGADQTLTTMAMDGLEPNTTAGQKPYYSVSSTQDLVNVLNTVAGQIVSCSYALQMAPQNPDLVSIQSNGMTVPHDTTHMDGWDYGPNDLSIIFYGQACKDLQQGITTSVSAVYACPPVS
ncbi:MAG: VWA domain-containing protein [Polyangia bacterium]